MKKSNLHYLGDVFHRSDFVNIKTFSILIVITICCLFSACSHYPAKYKISDSEIALELNKNGEIVRAVLGKQEFDIPLTGCIRFDSCEVTDIKISRQAGGARVEKTWSYHGRKFFSVETFTSHDGSINWKMSIEDKNNDFWSVPVKTVFRYPLTGETRCWSAWSDPRQGTLLNMTDEDLIKKGIIPDAENANDWADPLVTIPLQNTKLWYGEEPYNYDETFKSFGLRNQQKNIICIPMLSVLENQQDIGLSFVLSLDDLMLNVSLEITEQGDVIISRENYRLGEGVKLDFSMDIVCHDADIRSVLKWITGTYPEYFNLDNEKAREMEGMWAYSMDWGDFDVEMMKKIGFKTNWKAIAFPWMGMYIPPVDDSVPWKAYDHRGDNSSDWVSINRLREYSGKMVEDGFRVLNYMNVCEFGTAIVPDPPLNMDEIDEKDLWKDPNAFLYSKLKDAIVKREFIEDTIWNYYYIRYPRNTNFFNSWHNCVILDCGEPSYQDFLLEQVRRHIEKLPATSGFNTDRIDWLRLYNVERDDGISWFDNRPVRSLNYSYKQLMDRLWPILQESGKYWFLDPNGVRIDFMNRCDGIMEELNTGQVLNCIGLMCINKPVGAWFRDSELKDKSDSEVESWFQNYLYLGIWPLAPFPENDHSLHPGPEVNRLFLDYAHLFKTLYDKEWVLESHLLKENSSAKTNIFKTSSGLVIPVMFADKGKDTITVEIKKEYVEGKNIRILHPGSESGIKTEYTVAVDYARIETPVVRRCAMIIISE
jgi:hypothetical protein